jgi:Spy/CpxP family protein refolding chaperone
MTISRFILTAALASALILPVATLAQVTPAPTPYTMPANGAGPGGQHGHGFGRAMHGITLSAAQTAQLKALHDQYRAAHPAGSPHDPQAEQQMRASMLNILTPAQRTQFEANLAQMRQGHMHGSHTGGQDPQPTPTPSV